MSSGIIFKLPDNTPTASDISLVITSSSCGSCSSCFSSTFANPSNNFEKAASLSSSFSELLLNTSATTGSTVSITSGVSSCVSCNETSTELIKLENASNLFWSSGDRLLLSEVSSETFCVSLCTSSNC